MTCREGCRTACHVSLVSWTATAIATALPQTFEKRGGLVAGEIGRLPAWRDPLIIILPFDRGKTRAGFGGSQKDGALLLFPETEPYGTEVVAVARIGIRTRSRVCSSSDLWYLDSRVQGREETLAGRHVSISEGFGHPTGACKVPSHRAENDVSLKTRHSCSNWFAHGHCAELPVQ